jgi:hypothetical protein
VGFVGAASAEVERNGAVRVSAIGEKKLKDEPRSRLWKKKSFPNEPFSNE